LLFIHKTLFKEKRREQGKLDTAQAEIEIEQQPQKKDGKLLVSALFGQQRWGS